MRIVNEDFMIDLIVKRLKQRDCINNGWVLEGFPNNLRQAEELAKHQITPNRFTKKIP
jgi:adenylate kinase